MSVLGQTAIGLYHFEQGDSDIAGRFEQLLFVGTFLWIEHGHLWYFYKK